VAVPVHEDHIRSSSDRRPGGPPGASADGGEGDAAGASAEADAPPAAPGDGAGGADERPADTAELEDDGAAADTLRASAIREPEDAGVAVAGSFAGTLPPQLHASAASAPRLEASKAPEGDREFERISTITAASSRDAVSAPRFEPSSEPSSLEGSKSDVMQHRRARFEFRYRAELTSSRVNARPKCPSRHAFGRASHRSRRPIASPPPRYAGHLALLGDRETTRAAFSWPEPSGDTANEARRLASLDNSAIDCTIHRRRPRSYHCPEGAT
jgi:hypothetical protein